MGGKVIMSALANRDGRQVLREAKQIAQDNGYFVVTRYDKGGEFYLLYRRCEPNNVFVGKRKGITAIYKLVTSATNFK